MGVLFLSHTDLISRDFLSHAIFISRDFLSHTEHRGKYKDGLLSTGIARLKKIASKENNRNSIASTPNTNRSGRQPSLHPQKGGGGPSNNGVDGMIQTVALLLSK